MSAPAVRAILIMAAAYVGGVVVFEAGGAPNAVFAGGEYALSALAAILFSRGVLELFIGVDRDIAFFVVLRKITDPFLALFGPITPGVLLPFAASLYTAFLLYLLKVFLFGDTLMWSLGLGEPQPPLFFFLYFLLFAG